MVKRMVIVFLVLLFLPGLVSAEIYKYRDPNGVLRFTDNLMEVPISQREHVEQYQEIKATTGVVEETPAQTPEEETAVPDPLAVEKELTGEKEALDTEYSQLTEMRKRLEAEPQPGTPEETAAYEEKIQDYNIQLKIYEAKQAAFREELEAYRNASKKQ